MQLNQINQNRLVNNFIEFVQIPSETNFENHFMNHLVKIADKNGFHPKIVNNNLIIQKKGIENKPKLFFCAHIDTVAPGVGVKPIIKDEVIYSDGTTILGADNKAAIAALFETLFILKENNINCGGLEVLLTTGEEQGFIGAKALQLDDLESRKGYVLDSEGKVGGIEMSSPGQLIVELNFLGDSNQTIKRHVFTKVKTFFKNFCLRNGSTHHIFKIGLNQDNNYGISIFFKTYNNHEIDIVKNELNLLPLRSNWENVSFNFKVINQPLQLKEDNSLVTLFKTATEKISLPSYFSENKSASDTNIISELGFNVANLAIGYEKIHTVDERIAISEMALLTKLLLTLIITHQNQ